MILNVIFGFWRNNLIITSDEKELWDLEKLVVEFRKLFDDKTSYLNLYGPQKILPERV